MASLAAEVEAKRRELEALDAKVSQTVGALYVHKLRRHAKERKREKEPVNGKGEETRDKNRLIRSFRTRKCGAGNPPRIDKLQLIALETLKAALCLQ